MLQVRVRHSLTFHIYVRSQAMGRLYLDAALGMKITFEFLKSLILGMSVCFTVHRQPKVNGARHRYKLNKYNNNSSREYVK